METPSEASSFQQETPEWVTASEHRPLGQGPLKGMEPTDPMIQRGSVSPQASRIRTRATFRSGRTGPGRPETVSGVVRKKGGKEGLISLEASGADA